MLKKLDLSKKSRTLMMVADHDDMSESIRAYQRCMKLVKFTECKFVTSKQLKLDGVEICQAGPINSISENNKFILTKLNDYIQTNTTKRY